MFYAIGAIVLGFILLVWSADCFVNGAAALARRLGVAPLVIGLTVVGLGTSAPEMIVAAVASWQGNSGLAVGNAIGSNITNIALVLGLTALIIPLTVQSDLLKRELPVLLGVMLVVLALCWDGELSRLDGVILIIGFVATIVWIVHLALKSRDSDPIKTEYEEELPADMSLKSAILWLVIGLLVLLLSSKLLVWGAVDIAVKMGLSDLVIGLTIVAIGTSLPELAATIGCALKGEPDMAVGNVIGSNLYNILAVMAMPGLIHPGGLDADVLTRDLPFMIGLTVLLFAMSYGFRGPGKINRLEGGGLLACFGGYMVYLYMTAVA